ncbi:hypothetical protein [Rosistilla oblonga]|uniref:hypothetical protein n=1 Tax=Rosistilla oblonga TaxID=2527990 RepID=UPI0011A7B175|nr:hypothetical protein [Rosistilla oblonga]
MTTINEIEKAISHLPPSQIEELARWLEAFRSTQQSPTPVDQWLKRSVGAAKPGITTAELMALTRGDE